EMWMPPGRSADEVIAQQAWAYRGEGQAPVLELVLGAANVASLAPRDVLYSMFVENRVAVLKCNPVNDYLAPHWENSFRALIDHGVLQIIKGDAAIRAYLGSHPQVQHIHHPGSGQAFGSNGFGPGEEGAAR